MFKGDNCTINLMHTAFTTLWHIRILCMFMITMSFDFKIHLDILQNVTESVYYLHTTLSTRTPFLIYSSENIIIKTVIGKTGRSPDVTLLSGYVKNLTD